MAKLNSLERKVQPISKKQSAAAPIATKRKQGRPQKRERLSVLERDDYLCVKCRANGRIVAGVEVDHIIPLHLGGSDTMDNKQLLCRECHSVKSASEEDGRRGGRR